MSNSKILLLSPPLFLNGEKPLIPKYLPYFLLTTAAHLEKSEFEVNVLDAYQKGTSTLEILEYIARESPKIIGICSAEPTRFVPINTQKKLIAKIKNIFPETNIIVFGLQYQEDIQEMLKDSIAIDYLVLGDPELVFTNLTNNICRGTPLNNPQGIIIRNELNKYIRYGQPATITNLDIISHPAYHLINLSDYPFNPHRYNSTKVFPMLAGRGCPWHRCTFCKEKSPLTRIPFRWRSPENLVNEIAIVQTKYGSDIEIQFYEPQFPTNLDWLKNLEKVLQERKIKFNWSCLSRVDQVNEQTLRLMQKLGCWNILFGIESFNPNLLKVASKGITPKQITKTIKLCNSIGIEVTGSFLIGLPEESPQDILESASLAAKYGVDYAQFFIAKWSNKTQPLNDQGYFTTEYDYSNYDFVGVSFIPQRYKNLKHLKSIQKLAYLIFYLNPRTIIKRLSKIRDLQSLKRLISGAIVFFKAVFS